MFMNATVQLQIDTYILTQNTDIKPSETRYQKKKKKINK
jgi:hypothetical protein